MKHLTIAALMIGCCLHAAFASAILRVPEDQPTIQAGIEAAEDGDMVLVAPGVYLENIDFLGKDIIVASSEGPGPTVIDGRQQESVVIFRSGEGPGARLSGFTLRNGKASETNFASGGGVFIQGSSPTIQGNVITKNLAAVGGGIEVYGGDPVIRSNKIVGNLHDPGYSGGWGGGISLEGGSSALVEGNVIEGQHWTGGLGGGIAINGAGAPIVKDNRILSNSADFGGPGGGVWSVESSVSLIQNLIAGNRSEFGGGIYVFAREDDEVLVAENTIADNVGENGGTIPGDGSAAYFVGAAPMTVVNNIFSGHQGREAVYCGVFPSPTFTSNDAFVTTGAGFGSDCDGGDANGNISADPLYRDPAHRDYRLSGQSPAIDAGSVVAGLPPRDLGRNPRIVDGDGDGDAEIDMGAFELAP